MRILEFRHGNGNNKSVLVGLTCLLVITISMIYSIKDVRYQVAFIPIPLGLVIYILSIIQSKTQPVKITNTLKLFTIIITYLLISMAALTSPSSNLYFPLIYHVIVSMSAACIGLQIYIGGKNIHILFQILIISILLRATIFYQFPSIPGIDTPFHHIPAILETMKSGQYSSASYQVGFPASHLRGAMGIIITKLNLKNGIYTSLFLPQATSVILVYVFVRRAWNKDRALFASLFVAIVSFNIVYGFRRVPQTTSITLLPLLLFTLIPMGNRFKVLATISFTVILLSHNAQPWVLIAFFMMLLILEKILIFYREDQRLSHTSIIIIIFIIIKLEHIFLTGYENNVYRLYVAIQSVFIDISGTRVPITTSGQGVYEYALLRFASSHLMIISILFSIFLWHLERIVSVVDLEFNEETINHAHQILSRYYEMIWYVPVGLLWTIAGFILISDAPGNTKIFAPLGILTAPLFSDFTELIVRYRKTIMGFAMIFLLITSIAFIGVIHPRSNVGEFNRPDTIALKHSEIAVIEFAGQSSRKSPIAVSGSTKRFLSNKLQSQNIEAINGQYVIQEGELITDSTVIYSNGGYYIASNISKGAA